MTNFLRNLRYALRQLLKSPGFTTVAIITLALGIGANTAIFSILDGLILRELPVPHPNQIVNFGAHTPGAHYGSLSLPMFEEIARNQTVFSSMFAVTGHMVNAESNGQFERVNMWAATGDFFSELGAVPEIGRLLGPGDVNLDAPFPQQVAVIGYGFWQRHYHGAKDVVGKTLKIEDLPFTIIGVTRREFRGTAAETGPEIMVPLNAEPLVAGETDVQKYLQRRNLLWLDPVARLKAGVTLDQARAQMESLWPGILRDSMPSQSSPEEHRILSSLQFSVESGARGWSILRNRFTRPVAVLLAISGMVLLIACLNLATLMLSRAAARSHEFGVRVALGATRPALARQMLTESLLLSVAGTLVGLAFAEWGNHALAAFMIEQLGYAARSAVDLSIDLRTLAFTAFLAIFCGVIFGLAPVWSASREAPRLALQEGSRNLGRGTGHLGRALIVTQVALSVVLFAGAGLFMRSLGKLRAVQPGFQIDGVLEVGLYPKPNGFKDLVDPVSYFHELTDRVSHLPGVYSAAFEHYGVGGGYTFDQNVRVHGLDGNVLSSDCERVMPGFFRTVGISLLQGRTFSWEDNPHSPHVVIISQDFAQRAFPNQDAVGQRIDIPAEPKWQNLEVIGVVSNTSLHDVHEPLQPTIYIPTLQHDSRADYDTLLVRTNLPPGAILGSIRQVVDSLGRQNVSSVDSLSESVSRSLVTERIIAMLSSFFGSLALLLAAIGLYGLMAYNVTQRTRELGIRFALGAERNGVLRMILRQTLMLTAGGIVIGIPCAFAASRLIAHMLFGITPYDPITFAAVAFVLLAIGTIAGYLPARRAAKVDPMVALRYE